MQAPFSTFDSRMIVFGSSRVERSSFVTIVIHEMCIDVENPPDLTYYGKNRSFAEQQHLGCVVFSIQGNQ